MKLTRSSYDTDLTDLQWALLAPLIPAAKPGGRRRSTNIREVVNAIFYLLRAGCAWRLLPHDFPKWQTVYSYFRRWENDGTWEALNTTLREQLREQAGRNLRPTALEGPRNLFVPLGVLQPLRSKQRSALPKQ